MQSWWRAIELFFLATTRKTIEKKKIDFSFDKCIKREVEKSCNKIKD
jgi:hypothetical protein